MKQIIFFIGSILIFAVLLVLVLQKQGGSKSLPLEKEEKTAGEKNSQTAKPVKITDIVINGENDWGDVSMKNGITQKTYKLKNTGQAKLTTQKIETSCMCTEAKLITSKESPFFGMVGHAGGNEWSADINPEEEADLIVRFDPNAHGPEGTGRIDRNVRIWFTALNSYSDINFTVNVIP